MKKTEHYICEFCNTMYSSELQCQMCEENHVHPHEIERSTYQPITSCKSGEPQYVYIRMSNGKLSKFKRVSGEYF